MVFLVGEDNYCCTLSWYAGKIKRVCRSTLSAEALSLQEGLDAAIYHRAMLMEVYGDGSSFAPIDALTDNKSVFDALFSTSLVDDKRLRIDISAIQESLKKDEVRSVKWCPGELQLANCLTKRGAKSNELLQVLVSGQLPGIYSHY